MRTVGFAIWQLQELENTTARYVVVRLREVRGVGKERGEAISAEIEQLPLGPLLSQLLQAQVIQEELSDHLKKLLSERNWLVHRARRENRGVLSNEDHFLRLMARLQDIADDALALHKTLATEMEEYVVRSGVSRELIDRESERLFRSWGFE
jgi:HEAT repeat protein